MPFILHPSPPSSDVTWFGFILVWHCIIWFSMVLHGLAWYYLVWHGITWFGMVWYGIGSSAVRCVGHYLQVPTHPPLTGCDTHTPSAASYPQSTLPSSGPTFFFWHFLLWIIFMWLESFRPRRLAVSFVPFSRSGRVTHADEIQKSTNLEVLKKYQRSFGQIQLTIFEKGIQWEEKG